MVPSITVQNASVEYPVFDAESASIRGQLLQLGVGGRLTWSNEKSGAKVLALDRLSFEARSGDRIAVTGHNGSGKTTLLRLLAGIYTPTSGSVHLVGTRNQILGFGSGLLMELTGRENVLRLSLLYGLSLVQAEESMDDIETFTGLGGFLSFPVRTYSTGMLTRLLFAIATSVAPDILIIDEAISTGDADFQKRAIDRISRLIDQVGILILSSHAEEVVKQFCNKRLELEAGRLIKYGVL